MTPQEKAKELFDKYSSVSNKMADYSIIYGPTAKLHALITADEILQADWFIENKQNYDSWVVYWQEVKQEIEKL